MYYVYMLLCEGDLIYTGITTDLDRRLREHQSGGARGAKFTKSHRPIRYAAAYRLLGRGPASRLERAIKQLPRAKKLALIEGACSLPEPFSGCQRVI